MLVKKLYSFGFTYPGNLPIGSIYTIAGVKHISIGNTLFIVELVSTKSAPTEFLRHNHLEQKYTALNLRCGVQIQDFSLFLI